MKKHVGKLVSLVLAIAMVLTMAVGMTAMAADASISVPTKDTHKYEVYQIFTGTLSEDGKTLSDLKWGFNGTGILGEAVAQDVLDALKAVNTTDKSNAEKLAVIERYATLTSKPVGTVDKDNSLLVATGYYLLKDKDGSLAGKEDAYTTYIVQVVGPTMVNRKAVQPTDTKEVQDEAADKYTNSTDETGYGQTADHKIGETFNFKLTATIPADADIKDYETYPITFVDTMSNGITFESIDSVTVNGTALKTGEYTCTAKEGQEGGNWTLKTKDLKSLIDATKDTVVTVVYKAHLNSNATVTPYTDKTGTTDNLNKSHITFNNNPNAFGEGKPEQGETPDKTVYVFTYEVKNTKVSDVKDKDGNKQALAGAKFTITASGSDSSLALVDKGNGVYAIPDKGYTGETVTVMTSADSTGNFNIEGLEDGTYTLTETEAPSKEYSLADPVTITISTHHKVENAQPQTTFTNSTNMVNEIVDKKASSLPSTGGIGTTIFYVVGIILVLGAAIVLVSRRKSNAQ